MAAFCFDMNCDDFQLNFTSNFFSLNSFCRVPSLNSCNFDSSGSTLNYFGMRKGVTFHALNKKLYIVLTMTGFPSPPHILV